MIEWDHQDIRRLMEGWLRGPMPERVLTRSRGYIEKFLEGEANDPGPAIGQFQLLWNVLMTRAGARLYDHDPGAVAALYEAYAFDFWFFVLRDRVFQRLAPGSRQVFFMKDLGLSMCQSLALGLFEQADILGEIWIRRLKDGSVSAGPTASKVGPFAIDLYCSWRNLPTPYAVRTADDSGPADYAELLAVWNSADVIKVRRAMRMACDLHTRESHDDDERVFDFSLETYRIYPIEIFAVERLRKALGLETQFPSHPLMDNPAAQLEMPDPPLPLVPDPLIQGLIERVNRL